MLDSHHLPTIAPWWCTLLLSVCCQEINQHGTRWWRSHAHCTHGVIPLNHPNLRRCSYSTRVWWSLLAKAMPDLSMLLMVMHESASNLGIDISPPLLLYGISEWKPFPSSSRLLVAVASLMSCPTYRHHYRVLHTQIPTIFCKTHSLTLPYGHTQLFARWCPQPMSLLRYPLGFLIASSRYISH
jgi:hypothetical protein